VCSPAILIAGLDDENLLESGDAVDTWVRVCEPVEVSGAGSSGSFDCGRRARGSGSLAEDPPDFHRSRVGGRGSSSDDSQRSAGPFRVGGGCACACSRRAASAYRAAGVTPPR
jgi:hypothetical protein